MKTVLNEQKAFTEFEVLAVAEAVYCKYGTDLGYDLGLKVLKYLSKARKEVEQCRN